MSKRLRKCLIICALLTALTMCVMVISGMYVLTRNQLRDRLTDQTELLAGLLAATDDPIALLEGSVYDNRVTLVSAQGNVLYDSVHPAGQMANHLNRPEIQTALQEGSCHSFRSSDTAGEVTLYYALRLQDGNVLRLSSEQKNVQSVVKSVAVWVILGSLLCVGAAAVLAQTITRQMVAPINAIDLEHPLDSTAYEELTPVLQRMDQQNRRISAQMDSMAHQRQQLDAILGGMREGLIILDHRRLVLTMNAAARDMLGAADAASGCALSVIDHSGELSALMDAGASHRDLQIRSRALHASISRVDAGGVVILLQDMTNDYLAEKSRRQFSANVSHELRTPLTTISGYAELLASGFVRAEDAADVGGKIHQESRCLLSLIEDIIRLSRLDEGVVGEMVPVELHHLSQVCMGKLSAAAARADVSMHIQGEAVWVQGDSPQLEEMLTNLIENGVKYNVPGGRVTITTGLMDGRPFASVRDTGVGIAPQHQSRVFERFYRVDKSRSKQTGGTGLGLSIVKHGAMIHHAEILLESEIGKGTCITLLFREALPLSPAQG